MATDNKNNGEDVGGQKASLADFVYDEIKRGIRDGEFNAGDRLRESELTEKLKVSRTPVREALRRLQSEGRLKSEPYRGVVVSELDRQEIAELFSVRQFAEGVAARLAAQNATEPEIDALENILKRAEELKDNRRELARINWNLHQAIYSCAHNRFLMAIYDTLSFSTALLRGERYMPEDRPDTLFDEHRAIVQAIRDRDPDAAEAAAQSHVKQAFRTYLDAAFLKQQSETSRPDDEREKE